MPSDAPAALALDSVPAMTAADIPLEPASTPALGTRASDHPAKHCDSSGTLQYPQGAAHFHGVDEAASGPAGRGPAEPGPAKPGGAAHPIPLTPEQWRKQPFLHPPESDGDPWHVWRRLTDPYGFTLAHVKLVVSAVSDMPDFDPDVMPIIEDYPRIAGLASGPAAGPAANTPVGQAEGPSDDPGAGSAVNTAILAVRDDRSVRSLHAVDPIPLGPKLRWQGVSKLLRYSRGPHGHGQQSTKCMHKWQALLSKWEPDKPNFSKRLRALVRLGIPDCIRGRFWEKITNADCVAQENVGYFERMCLAHFDHSDACAKQIAKDIERTFSRHIFFNDFVLAGTDYTGYVVYRPAALGRHREYTLANYADLPGVAKELLPRFRPSEHAQMPVSHGHAHMFNLLYAYANHDHEVGYVQGMSFIAGLLLMYLTPSQAFWVFEGLMSRYHFRGLYCPGLPLLNLFIYTLKDLMQQLTPRLHAHMVAHDVPFGAFCPGWFMTLYSYSFPFEAILKVWDAILLDGTIAVFQVAMAIILELHDQLLGGDLSSILGLLSRVPAELFDNERIFRRMRKVKISRKKLAHIQNKFYAEQQEAGAPGPEGQPTGGRGGGLSLLRRRRGKARAGGGA